MITKGLRLGQQSNMAVDTKNIARGSVWSAIRSLTRQDASGDWRYSIFRATQAENACRPDASRPTDYYRHYSARSATSVT
jgi:hypothetical protein